MTQSLEDALSQPDSPNQTYVGDVMANLKKTIRGPLDEPAGRMAALRSVSMPLDDLEKSIVNARDRVRRSATNVRQLADRLFGPELEGENGPKGPPRVGRLGNLQDGIETVHEAMSALEHELDRLAPLVGGT